MESIFCEVSKYVMIVFFAIYTFECFSAFIKKKNNKSREDVFRRQILIMFTIHFDAFLVLYDQTENTAILIFYAAQVVFFIIILSSYHTLYEQASQLLINNMCMMMMIGFIILTRLSYEKALRQFVIAVGAMMFALGIPFLIKKIRFIRRLTWLYAVVGLGALAVVAALGATSYGAKISYTIFGITVQPSEFVKIVFVFFVAGMLYQNTSFRRVCITTVLAALHVLTLVVSNDLGAALIFFIVYLTMLYVATRKPIYYFSGLASGVLASMVAYKLFSHVQVRVIAWKDPLSVIDNEGYQICQSLFAIGTGGWFGSGLYQGTPGKIPVVDQDFVFAAISEEMGGIFALCLILVCMSCFIMFLNIAMQLKDSFYKLIALGLGTTYGFQVFLTIGGTIKFIPSTGVTLPLISYGGSSLLSTIVIFAIIQGFYILRETEGERNEKKGIKQKTAFDTKVEEFR